MKKITLSFSLTLTVLVVSCADIKSPESQQVANFFADVNESSTLIQDAEIRAQQTISAQSPETLTMDRNVGYQRERLPVFDVSVHGVDAREFFLGLVIDTEENMLVHPEVTGNITLELKHVSVPQVLEAVRKVYGYDYKLNEIGYMVYPATLQTKIFKINRLDLVREGRSNTRVSSGQIADTSDSEATATDSSANENGRNIGTNTTGSSINTKTETDFWSELDMALQSILSVDKQATTVINRQSGTVVVRAKPMQLREIEDFISMTQAQISRQVVLEAKILEIILDEAHQTGVSWESIVREGIDKAPLVTGNPLGALNLAKDTFDVFTIGATAGDFSAFVELLESQGKANILSSPRISTLNNQKAIIKVGQDEFFITDVSSTNSTLANAPSQASNTITQDITWTPFFSGIVLDVTPQIDDDEDITLHIHPSITRVVEQRKKFIVNAQEGEIPLAQNTVRESDSIVKARNGQIIVLGGLMQETIEEDKEGGAGLAQIPYLGNLFRINKGKTQKTELIILLKPTIIKSQSDWQSDLIPSQQRFEQLNSKQLWK
ncbi:MAG: secretin N-terminal domain-containing protein [Methylomicrobium sp.]|nr:secretin N-terminal domain-containing protein [Methylomicrobium sp.]